MRGWVSSLPLEPVISPSGGSKSRIKIQAGLGLSKFVEENLTQAFYQLPDGYPCYSSITPVPSSIHTQMEFPHVPMSTLSLEWQQWSYWIRTPSQSFISNKLVVSEIQSYSESWCEEATRVQLKMEVERGKAQFHLWQESSDLLLFTQLWKM